MGFARIKGPLTSCVGNYVSFGPPQDVARAGGGKATGKIIADVWLDEALNHSPPAPASPQHWGDYSFSAQLIQWDSGEHSTRLAYYRRRAGENHWEFACQTTVCSDPDTIRQLCELTLAQSTWFQPSTGK